MLFLRLQSMAKNIDKDQVALIRAFRSGDKRAFEKLVRMYYDCVQEACRALCKNQQEANELIILVFVDFWRHRKRIRIDTPLSTWLIQLTKIVHHDRRF